VDLNNAKIERSPRDVMHVLFRHKRSVMLALLSGLVLAVLINAVASRVFESRARLLVRLGRESVTLDPTASTGHVVNVTQTRESEINSEIEILRSRELAQGVMEAMPVLLERYRAPEQALSALQESLEVEALKGTNIISLTYESSSPERAQAVLARLIDLYLDKHIAVHRTSGSYGFFLQETDRLRTQLREKEEQLRDLKNRAKIGSVEEQRRLMLGRMGSLQEEIQECQASLSGSRAKLISMQETLSSLPETLVTTETTGMPDTAVDGMRQKLYDLQLKEQELLSKYNEDSPPVRDIRRQVAEAKDLLASESQRRTQVTKGLSAPHQQVKADVSTERAYQSSLSAKIAALKTQLEGSRAEMTRLNAAEVNLAQLEREVETLRSTYRKYSDNLEQARIDQALENEKISNISVVQGATLEPDRVRPRTTLNLVLGLLFGIVMGLAFAFAGEYFDHTFRMPKDVEENLQTPTLIAIPEFRDADGRRESKIVRARRAGAPGDSEPGVGAGTEGLTSLASEIRRYSENLWDRLMVSTNGTFKTPCVLAVTSCRSGEGTSTVATSLAATIRMAGQKRVLLVDARRLERSSETTDFCLPPEAVHIATDGLFARGTEAEASLPKDLKSLFRREGTFVVVDTPPLLESALALRICSSASGVVLVVEAEKTRWEVAKEAREMLRRSDAHLLGVVLNRRRFHVPDWLYRKI
jgi:uncharacterized protein involved in exopolysaccharide biosynthesis